MFKEVSPRVRVFQNNKCMLCGKVEVGKRHHVHHVFYEKKTCCWVDDSGIYWTNLNAPNHKMKNYYIGNNPNYFALLCDKCHSKTNGTFKNRSKYANILSDIIDFILMENLITQRKK